MHPNILSRIGGTPLIQLSRIFRGADFHLYAKLESLNPGGSIKDRAAISIIRQGLATGEIKPDTVIIESSSGNMGIGLAQVCAYHRLRFICVIDPKTTANNIALLKAYGAEVDYVSEPDPQTGEYLQARISRVRELCETVPNSYWPDQYSNAYNQRAHLETMREIVEELGRVDYLFCATSTCGTVSGCAAYARAHGLGTKIVAVDAVGSVIFGGKPAKRLIPGHGAAVRPKLYQPELVDRSVHLTDMECVVGCRRLVREEAIMAGGSSGAVIMAVEHLKDEIEPGSNCVAILADRGERYLDTIYSDRWVEHYWGDLSHLWETRGERETCVTATF
ncbi:MAG: 2,3-diaminopropionate biosynthesis protein SbnA [Acidobacteria bacterium]|nr:2,3-diaminopropionate biosynthesis protein SbnA [Acidobacteriota bacterium]